MTMFRYVSTNDEVHVEKGLCTTSPPSPLSQAPTAVTLTPETGSAGTAQAERYNLLIFCRILKYWKRRKDSKGPSQNRKSPVAPGKRQLSEYPTGYPILAAFLDSDESYMIFRGFGNLQSRLLLHKQERLRVLEKSLYKLDLYDYGVKPQVLLESSLDEQDSELRRTLFTKIETELRDYASLLLVSQELRNLRKPARGDIRNVGNFLKYKRPVLGMEAQWISETDDLVTLRSGREHAWLDACIESVLRWVRDTLGAQKLVDFLFSSPGTRRKTHGPMVYFDRSRIETVAVTLIILAILTLLIIPIYILYRLVVFNGTDKAYAICIGVLLVFTLLFSAVLSLFTRAKRHEILGAAAAYGAVLVVFLGYVNPKGERRI